MNPSRFNAPTEKPIVAVFGSSTTQRTDPQWSVALELGEKLARQGFAVMNGGYAGSMEAVSEGARKAGGEVIGVTVSLFNFRSPNPHLTHREDTTTLLERLDYLVHVASAFVVLEGSVGTMAELFLTWNLLAVDGRPQAPLVCLGGPYEGFVRAATAPGLVLPELAKFVEIAKDPEDAVAKIASALKAVKR